MNIFFVLFLLIFFDPSVVDGDCDCTCFVIVDEDMLDNDESGFVDVTDFYGDTNSAIDNFLGNPNNRDFCKQSDLPPCLMNHKDQDQCVDVGVSNPEKDNKIKKPNGDDCDGSPYDDTYYNPLFTWNRMTGEPGLCGEGVTARYPAGHGSLDSGMWRIYPVTDSDGVQVVGYVSGTGDTRCQLPDVVPNGYRVQQGSSGNRFNDNQNGGDWVRWDQVTYNEWVQAYLMGLINKLCLTTKIRNFQPLTNIEVHEMKGKTCLAAAYDSDVSSSLLGGELVTDNLGNQKLGVFKFTVIDFEIPPGTGKGQPCDPPNGKGCGQMPLDKVGSGKDDMYLLMWIQVECDEGLGGYVWEDTVSDVTTACETQSCDEYFPLSQIDVEISIKTAKYCPAAETLVVEVGWNGEHCNPLVRVWVDGGDWGNDLTVPLSVDGYGVNCDDACGGNRGSGGDCYAYIPSTENLKDRFVMVSSCGGGSDGGGDSESSWKVSEANDNDQICLDLAGIDLFPSPTVGRTPNCDADTPSPPPTPSEVTILECPEWPVGNEIRVVRELDFDLAPDGTRPRNGMLGLENFWNSWNGLKLFTTDTTFASTNACPSPSRPVTANPPQIFDSDFKNFDGDLATPNQWHGGQGTSGSNEGGAVAPGLNLEYLHNILIISECNIESRPDDLGPGGDIWLNFTTGSVPITFIDFVDVDLNEVGGFVELLDENDNFVASRSIKAFGENAYYAAIFNEAAANVIHVHFPGSGGLGGIHFCNELDLATVGDYIWLDINGDGLQDSYEWGIEGARATLHANGRNNDNQRIAQETTLQDGRYLFTSLPEASYVIAFQIPLDYFPVVSGFGFQFTKKDEGNNNEVDSDVTFDKNDDGFKRGKTTQFAIGSAENDLSWDAGVVINGNTENCVYDAEWLKDNSNKWPIDNIKIGSSIFSKSDIVFSLDEGNAVGEMDTLQGLYFASILSLAFGADPTVGNVGPTLESSFEWLDGGSASETISDLIEILFEFTRGWGSYPDNCENPEPSCLQCPESTFPNCVSACINDQCDFECELEPKLPCDSFPGCTCFVIIGEDELDVDDAAFVDISEYYGAPGGPIDQFLGDNRDFCEEDLLTSCLLNHRGLDQCVDVGGFSPSSGNKIETPNGDNCQGSPYTNTYYSPLFMWNRMPSNSGVCGTGITARYPSSNMWKIIPVIDGTDNVEVVGYVDGTGSTRCPLPGTVPPGYTVQQKSGGTRGPESMSGGDQVSWDEVLFDEWVQAYLMGLIHQDCLETDIKRLQPLTGIEVREMKGQSCLAMVYDNDLGVSSGANGEYVTSDLGNDRLGVFKFRVVDYELPPGTGNNGDDCDPPNGLGCGDISLNKVGSNEDDMFLLAWLQIECEEGEGGYVWEDTVSEVSNVCSQRSCDEYFPLTATDSSLRIMSATWCDHTSALIVEMNWNGAGRVCNPLIRVWVDGGDLGNDLNVPLAIDAYAVQCDVDSCDANGLSTGADCVVYIPSTQDVRDRWVMISSCGGGSQGGGNTVFKVSSASDCSDYPEDTILYPSPSSGPMHTCFPPAPPPPSSFPCVTPLDYEYELPTIVHYHGCDITITIDSYNMTNLTICTEKHKCNIDAFDTSGVICPRKYVCRGSQSEGSTGVSFQLNHTDNTMDLTGSYLFSPGPDENLYVEWRDSGDPTAVNKQGSSEQCANP